MRRWLLVAAAAIAGAQAMQIPSKKPEGPAEAVMPPLPPPHVFEIPEDSRLFTNDPEAGGVTISPSDGKIEPYANFSVTFPVDIVTPDKIDTESAESPISVWPPLEASFYWRSPASGDWVVTGPRIPGQAYRLRLREDLKALDGSPLPVSAWGAELFSDPLTVSSGYEERDQLNSRPIVPLEFNYPVRIHDVAEGLWFQDRASRKRFPAQVQIEEEDDDKSSPPAPTSIRAIPREPLPVGSFYDLVVENVRDAYSGRTLPYPRVFALGSTRPLAVDFVAARNWATDRPHIEIKFRAGLSDAPLPANAVSVVPPVPDLKLRKDSDRIYVDGRFDTKIRYKVTIAKSVTGDRGFPMEADSLWGATFPEKPPTILFPPGEFRQRGSLGLRFALMQANTGALRWRLARVPEARLAQVLEATHAGARDGDPLLIDSLGLDVVGSGGFPAVDNDREELRTISCRPNAALAGPYLIEASAPTAGGGTVANRALVWFSDLALTQKLAPESLTVRISAMGTGRPQDGVQVRLLTKELLEVASAVSDGDGLVTFPRSSSTAASYFLTTFQGTTTLWPAAPDGQFSSGSSYFTPQPSVLGRILTDRPLYRPGQELRIKGFVREKRDGRLTVPAGSPVNWEITQAWQDTVLASGTARVNSSGGWDAQWKTPEDGGLGEFRVRARLGAADAGYPAPFKVEEFRNPPFSVGCEAEDSAGPAESVVTVSSRYFHGAPNAGARVKWKATWLSDHQEGYYSSETADGFNQVDLYSRSVKPAVFDAVAEGEAALNGNGQATITCKPPFPDPGIRADATVLWQIDVTGPDGQTITGGVTDEVRMNEVTLGVKAVEERPEGSVRFELRAAPRQEGGPVPARVPVTLFLVKAKSVKEQIAPFVYRYRNFDDFQSVVSREVPSSGTWDFPVKEPGRYVLVVGPVAGGIQVSDQQDVTGPGESEFPVRSDESLTVTSPEKPVETGTNAVFNILAPSGGVAWVTVETDRILESRTVELPGNASRLEIPVREEFLPNATVSVYLLRPGGDGGIPGEMFGYGTFRVADPARVLDVQPATAKPSYEPREKVTGSVRITSAGVPVEGAEVTLYAVDDSILELGGWSLPDIAEPFFPQNPFNVITSPALRGLSEGVGPDQLTQKGYLVGDGGGEEFGSVNFIRRDFKPILFWRPDLKTDANGAVAFETSAPDNLTRFRVIALAQTARGQFGSASSTFEVAKKLIIEPALPRFLRQGDTIELRAVARQKYAASVPLEVTCTTSLTMAGTNRIDLSAQKDAPSVVRFPAVVPADATSATVRFQVSATAGEKASDTVEVTLPVLPRSVVVRESRTGNWSGGSFEPADYMPASWTTSRGTVSTTLSTSPWLTKLMGLPAVLDYPHGCLEQQSSRILAFTALGDLLKWIPTDKKRDENYRRGILESLNVLEASLLPDGFLPYWPMGTTGNAYVTIQSALACAMAESGGFDVPERLGRELPAALQAMAGRTIKVTPTLRAFALYVLSQIQDPAELAQAADDLYLERDRLTYEGKALLALVFAGLESGREKAVQLAGELPAAPTEQGFDPSTFSSPTRTEALCLLAKFSVSPDGHAEEIRSRLGKLMESSESLSTQENLWLLFTFRALLKAQPPVPLAKDVRPAPDAISPNRASAGWAAINLGDAAKSVITGLGSGSKGTFILSAQRQLPDSESEPARNGLRLDRALKNVTDPARTGTPDAPFRIGDEILITYRFQSQKAQSFLALEDALPAAVEVLNPDLDMFGKTYALQAEAGVSTAALSHSEMHDSRTDLFFDEVPAGLHSYTILARVTSAGSFAWPAAQISPMYDSRFSARTAPSTCTVQAETR